MHSIERCGLTGLALIIFVGLFTASGSAQAMSSQTDMHARVQAIYNFSPSKVTAETRDSKSKVMDSFWNDVKGHPDIELPLLRKELGDPSNPRFFYADGSSLLLSLSHSPEDQQLAVLSLAQVDLSDFQSRQYLFEVHDLALSSADVTPAALHMLDDPKFQVFLPEHGAYRLDQSACLLVALLPLPTKVWLPGIIERIKAESNETAIKSLLLLLFYAQTDESDSVIKQFATSLGTSSTVRDSADSILKHEREIRTGKQPSRQLEVKLREERQKRVAAVSDEAMDDMNVLTEKIARSRTVVQ
jgi:hypothetical protein